MNIFVLSLNKKECAQWHVDKHCVKMILEYCQLLYTCHWVKTHPELVNYKSAVALSKYQKTLNVPQYILSAPLCKTTNENGYRPCHVNHPCNIWVGQSGGNYIWLCMLAMELCKEYTYRFSKIHKCQEHIEWLTNHIPPNMKKTHPRTKFAIAMGDEFKISEDPVECYRHYYVASKKERGLAVYSGRNPPDWIY
jgi:hypothetical protein